MVKAWYMNNDGDKDQREELHLDPPLYVTLEDLSAKTGVLYWLLDADNYEGQLTKICEERNYNYKDVIELSREKLENYDEKLKIFYKEHLHADEEIRFVLRGSGYFDVRDNEDKWIRILVTKGDLIILPAGIYHRFTLDHLNDIKVIRLFVGEPVWTPYNRPSDDHPARKNYIQHLAEYSNKIIG